jgi:hypothetical protein
MIGAGNRTILDAVQTVTFGDKNFKVVNEFVYLEALVTPKNDVGLEIQQRIQRSSLRSSHLACQTKFAIYKTLIRQKIGCGAFSGIYRVLVKFQTNLLINFIE